MDKSPTEIKRNFWVAQIGKTVSAKNYRSATATGTLLRITAGVWGYGGDSVALVLDTKDDRGFNEWPADHCSVVGDTSPVSLSGMEFTCIAKDVEYRSGMGWTFRREQGTTPHGNPISGRWVLRNKAGAWVDCDASRHDLAEKYGIKLGQTPQDEAINR